MESEREDERMNAGWDGPVSEQVPPGLLRTGEDPPPTLRLVIAGGTGTARELAQAVQETCNSLAGQVETFRRAADEAQAQGDQLRQALCRGQILAYLGAAESITEHIVERFDLWDQIEGAGLLALTCWSEKDETPDHNGVRRGVRAPMVLPQTSPEVLRLAVAAIEEKRDMFGATAIQLSAEARELAEDGEIDRYHLGAVAKVYAMAADHLDEALATAYGRREEYDAHVNQHGLWAERTI